ncbi:MAG: GNAT family N-acetyltransferase [Sphingobacteriales bacterium]|nr:MAG: GNAT family N-acetyltransferase [Sphingobacteriales bacterium]
MNSTSCFVEAILPKRCVPVQSTEVGITTEIYETISDIASSEWDHVVSRQNNLFLTHAYLSALEESHRNILRFRYLLFFFQNKVVGAACFQLFEVIAKEALKNEPEPDLQIPSSFYKRMVGGLRKKIRDISFRQISKLRLRVLVCGNALLTGEHGVFFSPQITSFQAGFLLSHAISRIEAEEKAAGRAINLTLIKDFPQNKAAEARKLLDFGYKEINFQPNMLMTLPEEWKSFDHYLLALSSKYRIRTKKVLSKGSKLEKKEFDLHDIRENLPEIYNFYLEVANSMDFNMLSAQPGYFVELKRQLEDRFVVNGYFLEGKLVGFICAFAANNHLEVHFTGYDHTINKEFAIYSNMLYDMVGLGLYRGVATLSFGRTALEIKSTVGAVGADMPAFIKYNNPCVHRFLIPLINQFNNTGWIPRHPFKHPAMEQ